MRGTSALVIGLLALGAAGGCGGSGGGDDGSGPIEIGMVAATTGPYAGGEAPLINGVKLAIKDINADGGIDGRDLKLSVKDTGSEQTGAVNAYNRAASDQPVAIMDTTITTFVLSQIADIETGGIPTFTGAAGAELAEDRPRNLFRIRSSDAIVPVAAARFALDDLGTEKIGVLRVNDDYGTSWEDAIEGVLSEQGIEPVAVESHGEDDKDLAPQLLSLKDAGAEVVIVASHPPTHVIAMKQRKQLGLDFDMIVSNSAILPTTLELVSASVTDGLYGTVDSVPSKERAASEWAARYEREYDLPADYSAAEYYDGVMVLADAIREVGTDPEAINEHLASLDAHEGLGNVYDFTEGGDGGEQVTIVRLRDNEPQIEKKLTAEG
jgi:branched-chain amino acid transport system substrate-binding protein